MSGSSGMDIRLRVTGLSCKSGWMSKNAHRTSYEKDKLDSAKMKRHWRVRG